MLFIFFRSTCFSTKNRYSFMQFMLQTPREVSFAITVGMEIAILSISLFTSVAFYSIKKTLIIRHECSAHCSQLNHTRGDSIHSAFPTGRQPLKRRCFYRQLVRQKSCHNGREKRRAFSKSGYTVRWAVVTTLFHSLPFLIDSNTQQNTCEQAPKTFVVINFS